MKVFFKFFITTTLVIVMLFSLTISVSALDIDVQPYAQVTECPNCTIGNLVNLGHVYRTWKGDGTRGHCDAPYDPEDTHQHNFTIDYYLHRCDNCGYEIKRDNNSYECCEITGICYKYEP